MKKENKDVERIKELFKAGIDCSQVVASAFAEETGYSEKDLLKMSACFGGGMCAGETCGTITGAMIVLGLKYGVFKEGDMAQKNVMMGKMAEFRSRFIEKRSKTLCRDFLGHDVSVPGEFEKVLEEGTMFSFCPYLVVDAIEILEDLLK